MQPSSDLDDNDDLIICPALTTTQNRQNTVIINNFLEHQCTLKKGCHIAVFSILTPEQAKYIKPDNPSPYATFRHKTQWGHPINLLLQMPKSEETNETYWFATPQEPGDEAQHTPIQKRITVQKLITLQKLEQLNPQDN